MKILVKQTDWSGWNGGSSNEKNLEYEIKLNKEVVVKATKFTAVKKSLFQKNSWVEIDFSFKIIKMGEDHLIIVTNGVAGGEYNREKKKYLPKESILKFGEILSFSTKTMDSGSSFDVSLVNN